MAFIHMNTVQYPGKHGAANCRLLGFYHQGARSVPNFVAISAVRLTYLLQDERFLSYRPREYLLI